MNVKNDDGTMSDEQNPRTTYESGTLRGTNEPSDLHVQPRDSLSDDLERVTAERDKYREALDEIKTVNILLVNWLGTAEACHDRIREIIDKLGT